MTQGSAPPPVQRRVAIAIAVVGSGVAVAALIAARTDLLRGAPLPAPAHVEPRVEPTEIEAAASLAVPSSTPSEEPSPETAETPDQPAPPLATPPCRQYYPACGTFSMPGVVADVECGCRAGETCNRAGATGRCVNRPRWLGP
jgi:hypothetical protein